MALNHTVQDPWEAQWIAQFDDQTISKIVLAAEWLGLTHLSMYMYIFTFKFKTMKQIHKIHCAFKQSI